MLQYAQDSLLTPKRDATLHKTTLSQLVQNKFHRAVALARGGHGERAVEAYREFKKDVKGEKRLQIESQV